MTLASLAEINCELSHYDTAFQLSSDALELANKFKKRDAIGWISHILANTESERGHYQSALAFAQQALKFYERSGLYSRQINELKTLIKELQEKLTD